MNDNPSKKYVWCKYDVKEPDSNSVGQQMPGDRRMLMVMVTVMVPIGLVDRLDVPSAEGCR